MVGFDLGKVLLLEGGAEGPFKGHITCQAEAAYQDL